MRRAANGPSKGGRPGITCPLIVGNYLSVERTRDGVPTVMTASGPEANSMNRLPVLATRDVSAVRMFTVKVPDASADASSV